MTLTDINDLKEAVLECSSTKEISDIFEECGEDCDADTAQAVLDSVRNADKGAFEIIDGSAYLDGSLISCINCGNKAPDTILGSAVELLSSVSAPHFGCCECGEQFGAKNNSK